MCTDIDGGDSYREEILANVRDAKVFLIFVNEKWAKSQECAFEFNYAMVRHLLNITWEKGKTSVLNGAIYNQTLPTKMKFYFIKAFALVFTRTKAPTSLLAIS